MSLPSTNASTVSFVERIICGNGWVYRTPNVETLECAQAAGVPPPRRVADGASLALGGLESALSIDCLTREASEGNKNPCAYLRVN